MTITNNLNLKSAAITEHILLLLGGDTTPLFKNCHGNIPMYRVVIKWLLQTPSNLNISCHFWEETPHLLLQLP